jgi:hypothetical protein
MINTKVVLVLRNLGHLKQLDIFAWNWARLLRPKANRVGVEGKKVVMVSLMRNVTQLKDCQYDSSIIMVLSWCVSDGLLSFWYHYGTDSGNFHKTFDAYSGQCGCYSGMTIKFYQRHRSCEICQFLLCQSFSRKRMLKMIKLVLNLYMDATKACLNRCQKQFRIENAW